MNFNYNNFLLPNTHLNLGYLGNQIFDLKFGKSKINTKVMLFHGILKTNIIFEVFKTEIDSLNNIDRQFVKNAYIL